LSNGLKVVYDPGRVKAVSLIIANMGTVVVFILVLAAVGLVVRKMVIDRRNGAGGCGCDNCNAACAKKKG
jgi:uncharacterized membrane protein